MADLISDLRDAVHSAYRDVVADPDSLTRLAGSIRRARRRRTAMRIYTSAIAASTAAVLVVTTVALWPATRTTPSITSPPPTAARTQVTLPGVAVAMSVLDAHRVLVLTGDATSSELVVVDTDHGQITTTQRLPGPAAALAVSGNEVWVVTRPDLSTSTHAPGLAHLRLPELTTAPVPTLPGGCQCPFSAVADDGRIWIGLADGGLRALNPVTGITVASATTGTSTTTHQPRVTSRLLVDPTGRYLYSVDFTDTNSVLTSRDPSDGHELASTPLNPGDRIVATRTGGISSVYLLGANGLQRLDGKTFQPVEIGGTIPPAAAGATILPVQGRTELLGVDLTTHTLRCANGTPDTTTPLPASVSSDADYAEQGTALLAATDTLYRVPIPPGCEDSVPAN